MDRLSRVSVKMPESLQARGEMRTVTEMACALLYDWRTR